MHVSVSEVTDIARGVEVVYHLTYETQGQTKPPCVADLVFRLLRLSNPVAIRGNPADGLSGQPEPGPAQPGLTTLRKGRPPANASICSRSNATARG